MANEAVMDTRKLSDVIGDIASKTSKDKNISIGQLMALMEERALALAILVFCLPNAQPIPMIPGMSTMFAAPIIIFSIQIVLGMQNMWLPKFISKREIKGEAVAMIANKSLGTFKKIEKFIKPRMEVLTSGIPEKFLALVMIFLAAIICIPIPFGNTAPAIAISLIAISIICRDGILAIIGCFAAIAATFIAGMVVFGGISIVNSIF